MSNTRLVYSTSDGDLRKQRGAAEPPPPPSDGFVRVQRTKSGRKGKTVTLVTGVPFGDVKAVAQALKRLCGTGGAVKDGVIEIQGDHRDRIAEHLRAQGHRVKLVGG